MWSKKILAFALAVMMVFTNTATAVASQEVTKLTVVKVNEEPDATETETDTVENEKEVISSEEEETSPVDVEEPEDVAGDLPEKNTNEPEVSEELEESPSEVTQIEVVERTVTQETVGDTSVVTENGFTIENGVLTAYSGAETEVVIPDTVTEIGSRVFYRSGIKKVTIPSSVKKIGTGVFANAQALEEVVWNEGLEEISVEAFQNCSSLKSISIGAEEATENTVHIPSSVKTTGVRIFNGCTNLTRMEIEEGMEKLPGCMAYEADTLQYVTIPDTVTEIGSSVFYRSGLKEVTIPSSVKKIGTSVFANAQALEEVVWNEGLEEISVEVFQNCSSLKSISIGAEEATENTVHIPSSVETTGVRIFKGCTNLTRMEIEEGMEKLPAYMSYEADALQYVTIPDTVNEIGSSAFYRSGLKEVTIPSSVKKIGTSVFANAQVLEEVVWNEGLEEISVEVFQNCSSLKSISIGAEEATENTVHIPSSVETTGVRIFKGCTNLTRMEIEEGMEKLPAYMAYEADALQYVTIPDTVNEIGSSAFYRSGLKEVTIPSSVKKIGTSVFANAQALEEVVWNEGLEEISVEVFQNCSSLKSISIGAEEATENTVHIPSSVETTGVRIFKGCTNLTRMEIEEGMEKLPACMAYEADTLQYVTIPDTVNEIGSSAFYRSGLKEVTIPSSVKKIGTGVFANAQALEEVVWNEGLEEISVEVFQNCSSLKSISIGAEEATENTVHIPSSVKTTGVRIFNGCTNLTRMEIEEGMEKLPACMAYEADTLQYVTIPDTVNEIGGSAFYGDSALVEVDFSNTLEIIGSSAFSGCTKLAEIHLPYSLKNIQGSVFNNCTALEEVIFYHALESIGTNAFAGCTLLSKVHFNSTKTEINRNVFQNTSENLVIYGYKYSTAVKYAEEQNIDYKVVTAMNIEEDSFSVANTETGINYCYNAVRKKGSGRNVAVLDSNGNIIAEGAWKATDSIILDANGGVEVTGFGFAEGTGELLYAVDADGNRLDMDLSKYEMVKTVPYEEYEMLYKNLEHLTIDEFEAKKIVLSYENRDGNALGMIMTTAMNYWNLLTETAKNTSVLPMMEKKELNSFSYDRYRSDIKEFTLNGTSSLAETTARMQLWQDSATYEKFKESLKANPLKVSALKDYVGIINQEKQEIKTIWMAFEENEELNSHVVLLDTSRNIELVTDEEKERLGIGKDENWYKVYLIDPDYPIYDDTSYYDGESIVNRVPELSDTYQIQNCLYIKEDSEDWIFNGKTNAGQKEVTYKSRSNSLGAYVLTAESFDSKIVDYANGNTVEPGDRTSLADGYSEITFNASDVVIKDLSDNTVFAMTGGSVTTNTLEYTKFDIDEVNPDGRKNVKVHVPEGTYVITVSEGFWLYCDKKGYCGTGSDGAITAVVSTSTEYDVTSAAGKEVTYYLGNYGTEAENDGINMEYRTTASAENYVGLALNAEGVLSVSMKELSAGVLYVVESQDVDIVYERNHVILAEGNEWNIVDFVNSRKVIFDSLGGTEISPQTVRIGELVVEPEKPTKEGYTLCGWSKEDTLVADWDFAVDTVCEDMTLYARWEKNVLDNNSVDTEICIDITDADLYVYDGKEIIPKLVVRDNNKVLTEGVDYKVTYKNNVNACNHNDTSIDDAKKPQAIVQGIGMYASSHKFIEYFSIRQADMEDIEITVPKYVAVKGKNKQQTVAPVVKTNKITVAAANYTVSYYTNETLTNKVNGLTTPGIYYVVIEAKKNNGVYNGNLKGNTVPIKVEVVAADKLLSKAKVSIGKNLKANPKLTDADFAICSVISQLKISKDTYKPATDDLKTWKQYFKVSAIDYDGSEIVQDEFYKVLNTAGTKMITICAVEGNDKAYVGEISVKITVAGVKLNKNQFKLSYGKEGDTAITKVEYTGSSMVPAIYSSLKEGTDYRVTYKSGKTVVSKEEIFNAGTYTAVIEGINQYSGSVSLKFTISKANLVNAYKNGMIRISSDEKIVEYTPLKAQKEFVVSYDADGSGNLYDAIELTKADYKISYKNNTNVSANGKTAYASITGTGNFTGTLKGDGKADSTSVKSGIAKELNYIIGSKELASKDVSVLVRGLIYKKSNLSGVKFEVYDSGKKIAASEYKGEVTEVGETVKLVITGQNKNYTGEKTIMMSKNLIKASDSKNVKISYKTDEKYYYNGQQLKPELVIKDASGNDITNCFDITYGENVKVGKATIKVTGKLESGYCDQTVLKFNILPKWMQWIFS